MKTETLETRKHRSQQPSSINRPLGPTENIYYLLDKLYCLNFVVFAEISGTLDVHKLNLALEAIQREQPLLRARIALVDGRHWFKSVRLEQSPLKVEVSPLRNWRLKIAAQLNAQFADDAPLARFLWFGSTGRRSVAAMVFHHCIADGKSGTNVLIEALRRAGGEDIPLRFQRARPSSQDLDLVETRGVIGGSVQKLNYWLNQGRTALMFAQQLPGYDMGLRPERNIKIIPFSVPKRTGQALLAACQAHGASVHGALGAAQVLALNAEFDSAEARNMALTSLADLRGLLGGNLTEHDLGLYIATLTTVHHIAAKPDFWKLAVDIRKQLKQILNSGDANLIHSIYPEDSLFPPTKLDALMIQAMVALGPPSSMLTNIGRLDPITLGNGARVRSVAFVVSPPAQHPICVTAASYLGCTYLNLLYDQHKVSDGQAQRIANSLIAFINAAAKS
jgi:NRPS condensation-like uncharacterized protein